MSPLGAPPLTNVSRVVATEQAVYVGQRGEQEVLRYSTTGEFVGTIGCRGGGPGEFLELARFGVVGDSVWAIDWGTRRLSLFAPHGALLRTTAFEPFATGDDPSRSPYSLMPEALGPDGGVLGWGGTAARLLADGTVQQAPIVRRSSDGSRSDTLGWYDKRHYGLMLRSADGRGLYWTQPVEAHTLAVYDAAHGKVCVVHRDRLAREGRAVIGVTCLDIRGDTVWRRDLAYAPVPIPAAIRDSLRESRVRPLRNQFSADDVDAALYIPTHWPPVSDAFVGADGSVWLRGPVVEGEVTYLVVNTTGDRVTRITVPESQRVLWVDHSVAWVQELDADDVPTLVRFSLQHASPR